MSRGLHWKGRPRLKYRNQPVRVAGYRFDSKLEARRYEQLCLLQIQGVVAWFIRRPRFDLAPGVTYVADFLIVWTRALFLERDYRRGDEVPLHELRVVSVEDTKGVETATFKLKMRLMAEKYPNVKVQILKREDLR